MTTLDPRINAFRPDIADERLSGLVEAARFVPGDDSYVHLDRVPLYLEPSFDAELQTEALTGEGIRIFEIHDGWAWGQLFTDGYVGYLPLEGLSPGYMAPTHRVTALRTFIYSAPDLKSPPQELLSMMGQIWVSGEASEFYELSSGGYVFKGHVAPTDWHERDFVAVAERFTGTPYLWGGRTSLGLDCSALVQLSLMSSGVVCRRDSYLQQGTLGEALSDLTDLSQLERGDFVFWKGHVGIMVDRDNLLHANAHHMAVAREPLIKAVERIRGSGSGEITALRRLPHGQKGNVF
jgi:cell wall-associated NlpC family hydrolase